MAHQLHYTSARSGLENRAGFQFVAASRHAGPWQATVAPFLVYRPPPSAPAQPTPTQAALLPVSFSCQRDGDHLILAQCRYLGTDYSGRYGNFLGHAVVASPAELGGLRPIELWRSPLWTDVGGGPHLPELIELPPGSEVEPDTILSWLGGRGDAAYPLLARLLDAVLGCLDGRAGQVVVVSDKVETVARWIAAVSYSIPQSEALDLSFVTYTADPDRSRQHLVGTTPDSVSGLRADAQVFDVDRALAGGAVAAGNPSRYAGPSRYAEAIATAWRRGSFEQLDDLLDLVGLAGGRSQPGRDAAAAVLALSHGPTQLTGAAEATAVAALIERAADRLPAAIWAGLAAQRGADLGATITGALYAAAQRTRRDDVADQVGAEWIGLALIDRAARVRPPVVRLSTPRRDALTGPAGAALRGSVDLDDLARILAIARDQGVPVELAAVRDGTAQAVQATTGDLAAIHDQLSPEERPALLAGAVDGLANADAARMRAVLSPAICDRLVDRPWTDAPRVGAYVLASYGRRHVDQRVGVTDTLVALAAGGGLSDGEVDRFVALAWETAPPTVPECLRLIGADGVLAQSDQSRPSIVDLARVALAGADIRRSETARLAQVLGYLDPSAADAEAVMAFRDLSQGDAAAGAQRFERVRDRASAELVKLVAVQAQAYLLAATAEQQSAAILHLPGGSTLRRDLIVGLAKRGSADVALAEVATRLYLAGAPEDRLSAEMAARTKDQFHAHEISLELRKVGGRRLAEAFERLRAIAKQPGRFPKKFW